MMTRDAVDGEIMRLSMMAASKDFATVRPGYGDHELIAAAAEPDGEISLDEIDRAAAELSAKTGIAWSSIMAMTRELSAGNSARELAAGLAAVTADVALSAGYDDTALFLSVSAAERDKLAGKGQALPDGSFPVHDADHLEAAKAQYHQGHLAGHSKAEVKAHINKAAARLGEPGLDDDDEDEDDSEGLSASYSYPGSADYGGYVPSGYDPAGEVARLTASHSQFFGLARKGQTALHSDESSQDQAQPRDGGKVHGEVDRLLRMHAKMFGGEDLDAGKHGSRAYAPRVTKFPAEAGRRLARRADSWAQERWEQPIPRRPLSPGASPTARWWSPRRRPAC